MLNVGMRSRPKKTRSKVVEKDMRKLNITKDMVEGRKQCPEVTHITFNTRSGKLRIVNENGDDQTALTDC